MPGYQFLFHIKFFDIHTSNNSSTARVLSQCSHLIEFCSPHYIAPAIYYNVSLVKSKNEDCTSRKTSLGPLHLHLH